MCGLCGSLSLWARGLAWNVSGYSASWPGHTVSYNVATTKFKCRVGFHRLLSPTLSSLMAGGVRVTINQHNPAGYTDRTATASSGRALATLLPPKPVHTFVRAHTQDYSALPTEGNICFWHIMFPNPTKKDYSRWPSTSWWQQISLKLSNLLISGPSAIHQTQSTWLCFLLQKQSGHALAVGK